MNNKNYHRLSFNCSSLKINSSFPVGTSTYQDDEYKTTFNKSDPTKAGLRVLDLGYLTEGTCVSFVVDVRCISIESGKPGISIDTRTGNSLTAGRKIACGAETSSKQWESLRCDFIVTNGNNWVSLVIGANTTAIGVFEYKNPRLLIESKHFTDKVFFSLLKGTDGIWRVDRNFARAGDPEVVSTENGRIKISWAEMNPGVSPIVNATIDSGLSAPNQSKFIAAHIQSASKNGCEIRMLLENWWYAPDVNTKDTTVRVHVIAMS